MIINWKSENCQTGVQELGSRAQCPTAVVGDARRATSENRLHQDVCCAQGVLKMQDWKTQD